MFDLRGMLGATVAALTIGACTTTSTTTSGPPTGMTPSQGAAYCATLTQAYAEYVGTIGEGLGGTFQGGEGADIDARVAIAQCQEGNTAPAIPVLQQKLRDARVPVPPPPAG